MKPFQSFVLLCILHLAAIPSLFGAEFFRKQTGTTTFAGNSTTVPIPIALSDISKSFLVFSSTIDNNEPQYYQVGGEITNTSTLTFVRDNTNGTVSISWQIFEFESGVFVQQGTTTAARNATTDVAITCIDLNKSFVITTASKDGSNYGNDDGFTADLTTSTSLQFNTNGGVGAGNSIDVYWQVIEYQGAIVKKVTGMLADTDTFAESDLMAQTGSQITNLAKTFVVSSHRQDVDLNPNNLPRTELISENVVRYTRVGSTGNLDFITYVVELTDQSTVTRGTESFGSGVTSSTFGVTVSSSSGVIGPGNLGRQGSTDFSGDDNTGHGWFTYETIGSTLQIQRATGTTGGNSSADAPWQIVTFEDTDSGLQTSTFYTIGSGDWEDSANWSYTPDGSSGAVPTGVYPRRTNNVVIQDTHTIDIDDVTDNNPCSQSPNGLGLGNVGPFTGSGDQMFYHTGDILIANGGTLSSSEEVMIAGYTLVEDGGTFTIMEDIVNLGYLEVSTSAIFNNEDDLILSGNSITILDNASSSFDDLYIDHTDATLCGEGSLVIGNDPNPATPTVQYFNTSTPERPEQICSGFIITCNNDDSDCVAFTAPSGGFSSGNSGPGGVGSATASGDVRIWFAANSINQVDGSNVAAWTDRSGYGNDATASGGNEPVFDSVNPALNGFPSVRFTAANNDYMSVPDDPSLDPVTVSMFVVGNHSNIADIGAGYLSKFLTNSADGYMITRNSNSNDVSFIIDGSPHTASISTGAYDVNAIITGVYDKTNLEIFKNGTTEDTDNYTSDITTNNNSLYLGATPDGPGVGVEAFLDGDIAEAVVFGRVVNNIERILARNYLSAKYALAITDDVYTMDDNANGDYDFEVAGIGQTSTDGSKHRDARGIGLVRMWNPADLDNDEFLMWGHDNGGLSNSADVDGTVIEERLTQIWRVSETADVGTVSISFDLNGIGNPLGSNLRLLIDQDDDFTTNDVTPIVGTVSGNVVVFSGVNFANADRFTLGNTDDSSPLPVELLNFVASTWGSRILITWTTSSELNNDYFTVQKSADGEHWEELTIVPGAGTTKRQQHYKIIDTQPLTGISYYRLKQTDFDGQFEYSKIISVKFDGIADLIVTPNPSTGVFTIKGHQLTSSQLRLYNSVGQVLHIESSVHNADTRINISAFPEGVYILQVADGPSLRSIRIVKR